MRSFFENVPAQYVPALKHLIEAMRETQDLLQQVRDRYGTDDPGKLAGMVGQEVNGVQVNGEAVEELRNLRAMHEERREAVHRFFTEIGQEGAPNVDFMQEQEG